MQCPGERAHGAVHRFLLAAERTAMWGVDIAHANLLNPLHAPMGAHAAARRNLMSPHCFSLLWKWNGRTSNVFRDWFMLMLRRGVATNDQEPLRYAEVRQQRMGAGGLTVGQIPTEFAGSLYTDTYFRDFKEARLSIPELIYFDWQDLKNWRVALGTIPNSMDVPPVELIDSSRFFSM